MTRAGAFVNAEHSYWEIGRGTAPDNAEISLARANEQHEPRVGSAIDFCEQDGPRWQRSALNAVIAFPSWLQS